MRQWVLPSIFPVILTPLGVYRPALIACAARSGSLQCHRRASRTHLVHVARDVQQQPLAPAPLPATAGRLQHTAHRCRLCCRDWRRRQGLKGAFYCILVRIAHRTCVGGKQMQRAAMKVTMMRICWLHRVVVVVVVAVVVVAVAVVDHVNGRGRGRMPSCRRAARQPTRRMRCL